MLRDQMINKAKVIISDAHQISFFKITLMLGNNRVGKQ